MAKHQHFSLHSLDELRAEMDRLELDLPISQNLTILGDAVAVGEKQAPNRFAVNPMEGFDATTEGAPQALSLRRYRRYAEGGAGLIWFEATAVLPEARSNPRQFYLHDGNVDAFAHLVEQTKKAGRDAFGREPVMILQMTHSGRYSKPSGVPVPLIAHHNPILDPVHKLGPDYPVVTDEYLDRLQDRFVYVAGLAAKAGFDGVGVKSCHRYLLAELHASFTREGRYGGSLENRTRVLRESARRIVEAYPGLLVTTRLNAYDALEYPYGFGVNKDDYRIPDLTEPLELVGRLREIGITLLNISIGNPYFNPHYNRPYDFPIRGMSVPGEHPLEGVVRIVHVVRQIQQSHPELPVVGSGYAWLRQFMPYVAAGVIERRWATLIGQGRGSFAYPDSVKDILEKGGMDPKKCCVTCSACTQIMRDGGMTGCVVHDSEIYGLHYRQARRFALDVLLAEAERCRDCVEATCSRGCPASIDIPGFIKAFAKQDIAGAYDILRQKNLLPEMCGFICPAAEQCQGGCLENIFCENPIRIQDMQLVVARTARLQGLTGVRLPEKGSGRRIAVVGAGPAGLACAIRLLELGHSITIVEKGRTFGGTPDAAIPEERFADAEAEVEAILKPARDAGRLTLKLGIALGTDVALEELQGEVDAVFLGLGLGASTSLGEAEGVVDALDFLVQCKNGFLAEVPKKVAVLGAGNTAMDAGTSALRLGARDCYLVYRRSFNEMPAWKNERDAFLDAGGHILLLMQPVAYETNDDGKLAGLKVARTELGEPDESGRRRPIVIPGSEFVLPVDLVIEAMGQGLSLNVKTALQQLRFTPKGLLAVDPQSLATNVPGIFAGGDLVNGGTTAVQGIAEGMKAAEGITAYLAGER